MKEYDYPTEEELEKIKAWEPSDIKGLLSFIKSIWWHPDWGFKLQENCLELHTGGWSGNEMIIDELEKTIFWFMFWQKSERGGHYYFQFEENYVLYEK